MLVHKAYQQLGVGFVKLRSSCNANSVAQYSGVSEGKLVAAVVLERLPVVLPELPDWAAAYHKFSFERRQKYRKDYPSELLNLASSSGGDSEGDVQFEPAPRFAQADEAGDMRSLQRALDKRLYLLVRGKLSSVSSSESIWHFPEKVLGSENTMRECAEQALAGQLGDETSVYFVGNAPCGHLPSADLLRFYYKAQLIGGKFKLVSHVKDYAWVTKAEMKTYLDISQQEFFRKLLTE